MSETMVEFDESDLLRNKLITPSWQRLRIESVGPWTPSKDQQSNNALLEAVVICNADNGDTEFAGVPLTIQFNDKKKARGFIEGFFKALGVEITPGRFNLAAAVGEQVEAFIENETYEGRTRNRINHKYRPVRKD